MDGDHGQLLTIWAVFSAFTIGFLFLTYRLLRSFRREKRTRPQKTDLFVETLKVQADRVQQAFQERDHSKEALQVLDEAYRSITRSIPVGLLVFRPDGKIILVNPALEKMLPEAEGERVCLDQLPKVLSDEISFLREHSEVLEKRVSLNWSEKECLADMSLVKLNNSWNLLTIQDKTGVIQLQKRLQIRNDLAHMGELASGITHEVKNSLSIIQGHIQLMRRKPEFQNNSSAQTVEDEIKRLLHVTRQFMQSSKAPLLHFQTCSMNELFQGIEKKWHTAIEKGHLILVPAESLNLKVDPDLLLTVFDNLILNGIEACREAGKDIRVKVTWRQDENGGFLFSVIDEGPGIIPEMEKKLFVPLVSSKSEGSGLGLFQARKIIQSHRGELHFSQNPTTFTIWLPTDSEESSGYLDHTT
jgi:nitrogen-specific signal transduction histidine kinase